MTYAELHARLGIMSPEQLAEPVIWWGDEIGGYVSELQELTEEHIVTDEGCEPRSVFADTPADDMPEVHGTLPAGRLVLVVDQEIEPPST